MRPSAPARIAPFMSAGTALLLLAGCAADPATAPDRAPGLPLAEIVAPLHEPAGFTRYVVQGMSGRPAPGWARVPRAVTFGTDPKAPLSPGGFARMTYPTGFLGGRAPGTTGTKSFGGRRPQELYVRLGVRVSANWYGHPSTVNKILHFWTTVPQRNMVYLALSGAGKQPLGIRVVCQGTPNDAACTRLLANTRVRSGFSRGAWHVIEVYLRLNTRGQADGVLRLWLDGVLTHDYRTLRLDAAAWSLVDWSPTWGGMSGVLSAPQAMDVDEIYVSGR